MFIASMLYFYSITIFIFNIFMLNIFIFISMKNVETFDLIVQVRWNYQGKPVPKDQNLETGCDGDKKYWLLIHNIQNNLSGRYSAIAENNAGIATSSALLAVEGRVY